MISALSAGVAYGLAQLRGARMGGARGDGGAAAEGEATGAGTPAQSRDIQELRRTDAQVRQHEAAHQAAGGPHAGGASFTYTRGSDGKNYAVAGEVPIDVSAESDPTATIRKMDTVKAAALAPSDPSPQDLRVAQQADAKKAQARQELQRERMGEGSGGAGPDSAAGDGAGASTPTARGAAAYGAVQALGSAARRGDLLGGGVWA